MMDCTDRHGRYFLRLLSKNVMLYTEMVATKSAIHGDRKKILSFNEIEKPLALQVGGSDKEELSLVSKIAEDLGYDEININLGCPSKKVMLYTEMVATKSAIHGDRKKILSFNEIEKPLGLQVGGSDKKELSLVSKIAEDLGYDEININLGCPSKKVQKNKFGACLIKEPDLVAECINEMVNSCKIPVSAKTRIGFDDIEDFNYLNSFIKKISDSGCKVIILHARKAVLKGLSPKENLKVPKLNYPMVYEIKKENNNLEIIINGGITDCFQIKDHLKKCDGVMIGRAIYQNPYFLADIENEIFDNTDVPTRSEITEKLIEYVKDEVKKGTRVNQIMRHTVGLYHGKTGANKWRRYLSDNMMARDSDFQKMNHIMEIVQNNEKANQTTS